MGTDPLASSFFDFEALAAAPLTRDPFAFVVVPHFIKPSAFKDIADDFPSVPGAGSFPPKSLSIGARFRTLLDELDGGCFQQAIERKFDIDLMDRPKMLTIRGHTRRKDGAVHTDTETKLITVLLYMNETWDHEGGRLRLLRSPSRCGIGRGFAGGRHFFAFRRSDVSWHGHEPYAGPRHVIQFNWMTKNEAAAWQRGRHLATATLKKVISFFL